MSRPEKFASRLLETSAAGYAGMAASLLFERQPGIAERYGQGAFETWKAQLQRWLLDLSAAVEAGEPRLFESRALWAKRAFLARGGSIEDLAAALESLRETLDDGMPGGVTASIATAIDLALARLADGDPQPEPEEAVGRAVLAYMTTILEGRPREAMDQLLQQTRAGTPAQSLYRDVLLPAQREAGRMWHIGELSIAEEHLVTATTQRAMALLCGATQPAKRQTEACALVACVQGNAHDLGPRAVADFFEMAGWRTINLGPDVPAEEIARGVELFGADVVVLAATLVPHLKTAERSIQRIRAATRRDVKILVGGSALDGSPDLWRKLGADGHAAKIDETETLASRLLGGDAGA